MTQPERTLLANRSTESLKERLKELDATLGALAIAQCEPPETLVWELQSVRDELDRRAPAMSEKKRDADKAPPPKPAANSKRDGGKRWLTGEIDPELWKKVLKEKQEEERKAGEKFPGGKQFPVPSRDDYDI